MIRKIAQFKDRDINRQIDNIVSNQFAGYKEVTINVPVVGQIVKADVGFLADRATQVGGYIGMQIEIVSSDNRFIYFKSNAGTGTVVLKVWKNQMVKQPAPPIPEPVPATTGGGGCGCG